MMVAFHIALNDDERLAHQKKKGNQIIYGMLAHIYVC